MNRIVFALATLGVAGSVGAGPATAATPEFGTVVSSTPVIADVTVPRQQCADQPGYVQAPTSGGGAVVGGILGGLAGNAIGAGAGRALATGVGAVAGAVFGNGVEAANTPPVPVTTTNCVYTRATERRVVGYDVVYEFNGQRYTTRAARDPGPRIALDVRPAGASSSPYDAPSADATPAYPAAPGYPVAAYDPAPYGPPLAYGAPYYGPAYYGPVAPIYFDARFGGRRHWR